MAVPVLAVLLLVIAAVLQETSPANAYYEYSKADFPPDFIFGASLSAPQAEGPALEDGKTASVMDTFYAQVWSKYERKSDLYHKYKEDVKLMAQTGLQALRFSISWSRLIPNGRGPVNPKALQYYNDFFNELVSHGIQPHVFLVHSDFPQALEDEYGGWINRQMVEDFTAYANVCFREFGDRVLHWITHNEPNYVIKTGYDYGTTPPGRCSAPFGSCARGNSTIEPYVAGHHMLLAHASAVRLYKKRYQAIQGGSIGFGILAAALRPETNSSEDLLAAQRADKFLHGWFLDPLINGDYPEIMKKSVGSRMPSFTEQESKLVKNSFDFIGTNCYATIIVRDNPRTNAEGEVRDMDMDSASNGKFVQENGLELRSMLELLKNAYGNPPVYVYENGYASVNPSLNDAARISYLKSAIGHVLDSVRNGSNARGYFIWSFMDVPEFGETGYRFGLHYVDFIDPYLNRYPRHSAQWYMTFLKGTSAAEINLLVSNSTMITQL